MVFVCFHLPMKKNGIHFKRIFMMLLGICTTPWNHEEPNGVWAIKIPWKDHETHHRVFMVSEYFYVHMVFMGNKNSASIKSPLNSAPWKSRFYFLGLINTSKNPWNPVSWLSKLSRLFHEYLMDLYVMWEISRAMNIENFTGFPCLF